MATRTQAAILFCPLLVKHRIVAVSFVVHAPAFGVDTFVYKYTILGHREHNARHSRQRALLSTKITEHVEPFYAFAQRFLCAAAIFALASAESVRRPGRMLDTVEAGRPLRLGAVELLASSVRAC
jgi:hypothetical protein